MIVILLTEPPTDRLAWYGLWLAQSCLTAKIPFQVFFYQNAVSVVNILAHQSADLPQLRDKWRALNIDLPVCVSAALLRGVADPNNAARHALPTHNVASGFRLTGLGELVEAVLAATRLVQL